MSKYILHNTSLLREEDFSLKINNRSFLYSDGFFESIKVINSECYNYRSHYNRIINSFQFFKAEFKISFHDFHDLLRKLIVSNEILGGRIRIVFYRDEGGKYLPSKYSISFIAEIEHSENKFCFNTIGLNIGLYEEFKKQSNPLSNFKTTNAQISVFASIFSSENNYDDCLMINNKNYVVESANSNLFLVDNGVIFTPPLSDYCVDGSMRSFVMNNFDVIEKSLSIQNVSKADELFLTNSIQGIKWVKSFKFHKFESNKISKLVFDKLKI